MTRLALAIVLVVACSAAAAAPVRVSLVQRPTALTVGQPWTAKLAVRPVSYRGTVRVIATGRGRLEVRATGRRGSYRARIVFPAAGRWTLTARTGSSTSRLGSVQVRPAGPQPLTFLWPTSIDLEPSGSLLLVENGRSRVLRIDPTTGSTSLVASPVERPFGVARAPSGSIFVSGAARLRRVDPGAAPVVVAEAPSDLGPVGIAANGDVYYTTATRTFRLPASGGPPVHVAGTGVEGGGGDGGPATSARIAAPHGLAIAADGALLLSDTGNDSLRRVDPATGVITSLAPVGIPNGLDVAAGGTIYVVEARTSRVIHFDSSGVRIGAVGPAFNQPNDVEVAADGTLFVLETGASGRLRRIAPDGTVTTIGRR
jgi:sugar lactone lactonase YvrE